MSDMSDETRQSRAPALRFYNPDWLDDTDLVENFVARRDLLAFLIDELQRAPLRGTVTHHLLIGIRGAGKTTLLKRLAVAIRKETALTDHLIALSFPEELYDVKGLADFWWAACEALADELDRAGNRKGADQLADAVDARRQQPRPADVHDEAGLRLLIETCAGLQRRPVLLVDNLDLILRRIDKSGRKLNDPHAQAYWALREALSKPDSPLMIAGSVRLSEPFTDYDKAFYDFFVPQRLGKLSLEDMQAVFDHLALRHDGEGLRERIRNQPGRLKALYDMTGGNPRALGLLFELLRQGPNGRAIDDFERLLDLTTPYYKARFEDLADQAQVVMHALAVVKRDFENAAFGHTAATISQHTGLETRTVSAQLDVLVNEGVVEKDSTQKGRTQFRIAEQLFRLWLQMRSTRRIRQNVVGLTEFLQAFYEREEFEAMIRAACAGQGGGSLHGLARMHYALGETQADPSQRRYLQSHAVDAVLQDGAEPFSAAFATGDLHPELEWLGTARERLAGCCRHWSGLRPDAGSLVTAMLGALTIGEERKRSSVDRLCDRDAAATELEALSTRLAIERGALQRDGLTSAQIDFLYRERSHGKWPLPGLSPESPELQEDEQCRELAWKLLIGLRIPISAASAELWIEWMRNTRPQADSADWAAVARTLRRAKQFPAAGIAVRTALALGNTARAWYEQAALAYEENADPESVEIAYRKAIDLAPADAWPWLGLGYLFHAKLQRHDEAESAYRKAIEIDPSHANAWNNLGFLLTDRLHRYDEAETAYRKAIEIDPLFAWPWNNLGLLLANKLHRYNEAETTYRKAIEIDPAYAYPWNNLGLLLSDRLHRYDEAEAAYRKAIEIDPSYANPWNNLGILLSDRLHRYDEAEAAFRKAIEIDPSYANAWNNLGFLLTDRLHRYDEAETAYRKAIKLDPAYALPWNNLGSLLSDKLQRYEEAETAYRKAIEIDPAYALAWRNLGRLLADQIDRFNEAEFAFKKAIELDANDLYAKHLLGRVSERRLAKDGIRAIDTSDWAGLRGLISDCLDQDPFELFSGGVEFLDELVIHALRTHRGTQLRDLLHESGADRKAAPLMHALSAILDNTPDRLNAIEPEARNAAIAIYERLQAGLKTDVPE